MLSICLNSPVLQPKRMIPVLTITFKIGHIVLVSLHITFKCEETDCCKLFIYFSKQNKPKNKFEELALETEMYLIILGPYYIMGVSNT